MKIRPSQLVELSPEDPIAVYCFDRAVNAFGDALSNELRSIEAKSKKEQEVKTRSVLAKWLPEKRQAGQLYRDPAKRSG